LITRRQFASAALVGLNAKAERNIAGGFVNDGSPWAIDCATGRSRRIRSRSFGFLW
jgi:hypothetical protein